MWHQHGGYTFAQRLLVDPLGYRREQLDISAAQRDFGWAPAWTLERGIADYAERLRKERLAREQ